MRACLCSYEALGLVSTLNPIASGGTEQPLSAQADHAADAPSEDEDEDDIDAEQPEASTSAAAASQPSGASAVPKGYGKIIRDAEGNVVDIQLADEDADEDLEAEGVEDTPDRGADDRLAGWVGLGSDPRKRAPESAGTRVVQGECYYRRAVAGGG